MSDKTKRVVGFTLGCFDLFHIGHINLLRNARALCDTLIVGVCSDEYMLNNKREPIYALNDRMEILKACKYCDVVVPEDTLEKVELYNKYKFDILFVGSDWYGDEIGVSVVYLPYTNEVSSSKIIQKIAQMRQIH